MDRQQLLGQAMSRHKLREVARHVVHACGGRVANRFTRNIATIHAPFRIEGEPDVGLHEILLVVMRLARERPISWLNVEDEQRMYAARRGEVTVDDSVACANAVGAGDAGLLLHDRRYKLEGR